MLVVSTQTMIVFEQLGLEHFAQRAGYSGLHIVSGELNFDGRAVEVHSGRKFAVERDLF